MAGNRQGDSDEALGQFLIGLRTRGFRASRLLEAVERAPRAEFVAAEHIGFAYRDMSLPLPSGQETGRPLAVVEAVAALLLERQHQVLEIGTGSGWQTALIAGLAGAAVSVERWATLAEAADERLVRLGFENAVVAHGDGAEGLPEAAPFDRIIFNVAVAEIPAAVAAQLAEGGLMLAPIVRDRRIMLTRFSRGAGGLVAEEIGPGDAPPLVEGIADGR
jgi:protein-L-isoaspartate(D-aspartate) O-methyltransferase